MEQKTKKYKTNSPGMLAGVGQYRYGLILLVVAMSVIPCAGNAQNSIEILPLSGIKVFADDALLTGRSYGIEAAYNIYQRDRKEEWIKRLRVRDITILAGYRNMSQVAIRDSINSKGFLRNIYTLSGRVSHSLLTIKKTEILYATTFGVTYSTSSYFTDGNPLVGSRINVTLQPGLKLRTSLTASTSFVAGADFFHYSNIGLKVPNNGVNSYELSLGVIKELKNTGKEIKPPVADSIKGLVEIGMDIGRRGVFKSKNKGNWKSGFYAGYNYRINRAVSFKAGTDAIYYYTPFTGTGDTFQYLSTSYDHWKYGVSLGADLWLGKLVLTSSYGYYLKFRSYYPIKYYWSLGLKYYTNQWLGYQFKMYANNYQADFAGFGLIFRIPAGTFKSEKPGGYK